MNISDMADSRYMCTLCPKSFIQKCHLNRHILNHKDAKYPCNYCKKTFHRKDLKSKHEDKCFVRSGQKDDRTCNLCSKVLSKKSHLIRHRKICKLKQQEKKLKKETDEYKQKLEKGEMLQKILRQNPDIMEEALSAGDEEALKLYQSSCNNDIEMGSVKLRPWQEEIIRFIDSPSERNIYWVVGSTGNEGKTFLQKYIHQLFGSRRVLKTELNARKVDMAYMLSQETLTCKDIFIFNLLRSDLDVSYGLLENIKDGYLISAKYRTKSVKIKTPNTIIVFSNKNPDVDQLSKDRWKIYYIRGSELCENETDFVSGTASRIQKHK